jgi:predicted regulator of Ras-like GTPase activity (Roadblock/LC7/MglB family)
MTKSIEVPLAAILQCLPVELQPRVMNVDVGTVAIHIPLERVLSQLSRGSVKISFGELRQTAPHAFSPEPDKDKVAVPLPLGELLSRINPALIARRRVQKQVEVPEDISSPFESGNAVAFSTASAKPEPAPAPAPAPRSTANPFTPASPQHKPFAAPHSQPPAPANPFAAPPAPIPFAAPAVPAAQANFNPFAAPANSSAQANNVNPFATPNNPSAQANNVNPFPNPANPSAQANNVNPFATPNNPSAQANNVNPFATPGNPSAQGNIFNPFPTPPGPPAQANNVNPFATPPAAPARSAMTSSPTPPPPGAQPLPHARITPSRGHDFGHQPPQTPAPAPNLPPQAPIPMAQKPRSAGPSLAVGLLSLAELWPDSVRKEIVQLNLMEAKVSLPVDVVEQGLKQGKIAFPWKTIRAWIQGAVLPSALPQDSTVVELPLKVVAPLFVNRQRDAGKQQQKVAIDSEIPNLFFGFPQPDSPSATPDPDSTGTSVTKPVPVDTNYYIWDDNEETAHVPDDAKKRTSPGTNFIARYATPNEVVSRAASLDGVAGALIALPDGLMVASRLAQDLNGDTLAAFLPQIFAKVSQCTKELRMGELNNLNFTVGNVPWKIFRVNAIFFAAFGRPGEPLPTASLASLAAELDHKAK